MNDFTLNAHKAKQSLLIIQGIEGAITLNVLVRDSDSKAVVSHGVHDSQAQWCLAAKLSNHPGSTGPFC